MASVKNQVEVLFKISKAITSELYLEDILKLIVTVTAQAMGSNVCSITLLDEKKQELVIRASQSISEAYLRKPPLKIGEGIAGKVFLDKKPRAVVNVLEDKDYKAKDIAKKDGVVSLLSVPMMVNNEVIGVLNLYTSHIHKFTKREIDIFMTVANQAALVIKNTELMVKTKVIQEELETRKLVEKAKGILMKDKGMSEEGAYKLLQRHSMNTRKTMRQIAEAVILSAEIRPGAL